MEKKTVAYLVSGKTIESKKGAPRTPFPLGTRTRRPVREGKGKREGIRGFWGSGIRGHEVKLLFNRFDLAVNDSVSSHHLLRARGDLAE